MTAALGFIVGVLALFAGSQSAPLLNGQGIGQLDQWKSDGTNITQQTANKPIKITGLTPGSCLTLDGSNVLTTTGCGGGGGGSFPFSATTNYGQTVYATNTPTLWLQGGIFASSTSHFVNFDASNSTTTNATSTRISTTYLKVGPDSTDDITGPALSITASGLGIASNALSLAMLPQVSANRLLGNATGATANPAEVATSSLFWDATAARTGLLNSTDWSTFNSKVATARQLTVAGTAGQITSSAGAQDLTADRTWTLSLPNHVIFPASFQATRGTTTNATSTNLSVTGSSTLATLFGAGLSSCTGTNALTWSGGVFACVAQQQGTVTSIATNNGITGGTITNSGTIGLATINQGVLANNANAATVPTSQATSTLYGAGITPGFVLTASNGAWTAMATATCIQITGSAGLCDGDDATGGGGGPSFGKAWEIDAANQLAPTTTLAVSIPKWLSINDQTFAYSSSTNSVTLLGMNAGGNAATTSAVQTRLTAIGVNALAVNATGGLRNTAVGYNALAANVNGDDSVAIGYNALAGYSENSINANTAIGASALAVLATGNQNVALGAGALAAADGALNNVALGRGALGGATGAISGNISIGLSNLNGASFSGNYNTFIGVQCGQNVTTGVSNTFIGSCDGGAGDNLISGSGNIAIGARPFLPSATDHYQLNIGNLLYGILPATSTAFRLPTTGTIGVASSSPFARFSIHAVNGSSLTTLFAIGSSTASATTTLFSITNTGAAVLNGQYANTIASSSAAAATYTVDWSTGNTQRFILNQNSTFIINATSSNPLDGGKYTLKLCQDVTGSRTVTFATPGQLVWWNGTTTITSTASRGTYIGMIYDARSARYDVVASSTNLDQRSCLP